MSVESRWKGAVAAVVPAVVLLVLGTTPAQAQTAAQPWSFDGRAGIAIPFGGLGDLVDVGPSFGAGVAYEIEPRVFLRFDGDLDLYGGADFGEGSGVMQPTGPDVILWHLTGSAEVELTDPTRNMPWRVTANGGVGLTVFDVDRFDVAVDNPRTTPVESIREFSSTSLTFVPGVKALYEVNPQLDVYGSLQWFLAFTDEDETAVFTELSGGQVGPFGSASSFPLTVGVRATF